MKITLCALVACALLVQPAPTQNDTKPAPPETLTLGDLARRPDRWPAEVVLTEDFDFQSGRSAVKGQAVRILEFDGRAVVVDAGDDLVFEIDVASCNLLEAANDFWKALTPAQRAVSPQALVEDASLWPAKVTCYAGFTLQDGGSIEPGTELFLLRVEREGLHLYSMEPRATLMAELEVTDVIARARERALVEPEKRTSRIAEALHGQMVDSSGVAFENEAVESADVYALYFSASWCGPCRKFTPGFVEYVKEVGPKNPKLAVVLLSRDEEDEKLYAYMQKDGMPWPAVPMEKLDATPALVGYAGSGIPHLVILDRHGKVLSTSYQNGRYVGPNVPLGTLKKLVASGATK